MTPDDRMMGLTPAVHQDISKPSWKIRRTVVICTLIFCGALTVYLTGWGKDDELRATIASGVLFLAGTVLTGYVFGVVWNDTSAMKHVSRLEQQQSYYGYGPPTYPPVGVGHDPSGGVNG